MLIKPWGVYLLALVGTLGLVSLLVGVAMDFHAMRVTHAAHMAGDRFNALIDSLSHDTTRVTIPRR